MIRLQGLKRIQLRTSSFQNQTQRTLFNNISSHPKNTLLWYKDFFLIMGIFGITGSTSVYVTRPLLNNVLGMEGSLKEGPWSYRISYVLLGLPCYSALLLTFSTLFRRNAYFFPVVYRMWSRFIPKSVLKRFQI